MTVAQLHYQYPFGCLWVWFNSGGGARRAEWCDTKIGLNLVSLYERGRARARATGALQSRARARVCVCAVSALGLSALSLGAGLRGLLPLSWCQLDIRPQTV